jgi:hypothetical protein
VLKVGVPRAGKGMKEEEEGFKTPGLAHGRDKK